jgi:flagellar biosynthetic protein FliR
VEALQTWAWIGALLFARLGAVLMLAPGWGEQAAPAQIRLAAALLVTFALAPATAGYAPPLPASIGLAAPLIVSEIFVGLILGGGARLLMSALQVAGATVGLASGLGFAQQVDPIASQPAAIFSGFFSLMGVVLVMSAGLHRVMLEAAAESYALFPPGSPPLFGEASAYALEAVATGFSLGLQIAAPVLIFSLIFNLALGVASRLVPQVQIFLVALPASVLLGVAVTALGLGGGLMVWLEAMERQAGAFLP